MVNYFIVLHTADQAVILEHLDTYYPEEHYLLTFELGEKGNNPHYHLILESETKINTIRQRLSRQIDCKRSVALCRDKDKSLHYILKDMNIIKTTYMPEDIAELKKKVRQSQMEFEKTILDTKAERKRKGKSYPQELLEKYERIPKQTAFYGGDHYKRTVIEHATTYIFKNYNRLTSRIVLENNIYHLLINAYPDEFATPEKERMVDRMENMFIYPN